MATVIFLQALFNSLSKEFFLSKEVVIIYKEGGLAVRCGRGQKNFACLDRGVKIFNTGLFLNSSPVLYLWF